MILKRNLTKHLLGAALLGAVTALAFPVRAAETPAVPAVPGAALEKMAKDIGVVMTPEKQAAMDAVVQKHMGGSQAEMDAAAKTLSRSLDTPEMRASMERISKEMSGVMARQLPVMMQAMQPLLQEMLPRMLRMQADMLQVMMAPPKTSAETH